MFNKGPADAVIRLNKLAGNFSPSFMPNQYLNFVSQGISAAPIVESINNFGTWKSCSIYDICKRDKERQMLWTNLGTFDEIVSIIVV